MARWSEAIWHRCPGKEPKIRPTQLIYHTAVMRDLDGLQQYFCGGGSGGIESHFGVGGKWGSSPAEDGQVRQWRDTTEQADANRTANRRPDGTGGVSVETTDNAPRFPDDIEPWTPKQVASLIRLGLWMRAEHGVPPRQCRDPGDPGFGWHGMWNDTPFEHPDGSTPWTPSAGKVCPGPRRIHQLKTVIFPAIFAGAVPEDEELPVDQDDFNKLMNGWAKTEAGKAALAPNDDDLRDALYPPIARGEFDGTPSPGHYNDSVRKAVAQGRFLRGGELTDPDGSVRFSIGHYMDSQRHLARELRALAVAWATAHGVDPATVLDVPGQAQVTLPGAVSPDAPPAVP